MNIKILLFFILLAMLVTSSISYKVNGWTKEGGQFQTYINEQFHIQFNYPVDFYTTIENGKGVDPISKTETVTPEDPLYDAMIFRANSISRSVVSEVDKNGLPGTTTIAGIPCVVVCLFPLDDTYTSVFAEMGKFGLVNFTVMKDEISSGTIQGYCKMSFVVNDNRIGDPACFGRTYYFYGAKLKDVVAGRMLMIGVVFDPSLYDEKFAMDILSTISIVSSDKDILSFTILNVAGVINGTNILVTVPFGTNVSSLAPTILLSGGSVDPPSNVLNNFSSPVTYTVSAADGTKKNYIVTVVVGQNSAKEMTSFAFEELKVEGKIDKNNIEMIVPSKTDITKLIATFITTGHSVEIDEIVQDSGKTVNDFTKPLIYRVIAEDQTFEDYIVTVTEEVL